MMEKIKLWVNKSTMTGNDSLTLEKKTASMKNRDGLKVAIGAHGAGILVPYDKSGKVENAHYKHSDVVNFSPELTCTLFDSL